MTDAPRSILVVLDKPKHAQVALDRALGIAAASGAQLHLASFCWLPMVEDSDFFDTHQRRALRKSAEQERRRWLDGLVLDRGLTEAAVATEVVWAQDIATWVAERVAAGRCDLVVKSVHQTRTLLHTPTDWALLRSCPVPVLLVSTQPHAGIRQVLATVDVGAAGAERQRLNETVARLAARFAELHDARLHVVNVVEFYPSFEDLDFFDPAKARRKAQADARARLKEMLIGYGVDHSRLHVPVGKVGQAVAELSGAIGADLVVVGTGTRRGLGAALLGNSAEKILGRLECDVLAVHA